MIKIVTGTIINGEQRNPGDVVDVNENMSRMMVQMGRAVCAPGLSRDIDAVMDVAATPPKKRKGK